MPLRPIYKIHDNEEVAGKTHLSNNIQFVFTAFLYLPPRKIAVSFFLRITPGKALGRKVAQIHIGIFKINRNIKIRQILG